MAEVTEIIQGLKELSGTDIQQVLDSINSMPKPDDYPYEIIRASEFDEGLEETTRVMVFDRKLKRKVNFGEEEKIDEIANAEGTMTYDPAAVPGGSTTISGQTVSYSELSKAIQRDFGPVAKGGGVYLSDGFYFLYHDNDIKKVLSEDLTDLQLWINTYFDCDDFAQVVAGTMNRYLKGIPYGILWFKGPGIYHAVNCFYSKNQRKMKLVEPQNDAIYDFNKAKYDPVLVMI